MIQYWCSFLSKSNEGSQLESREEDEKARKDGIMLEVMQSKDSCVSIWRPGLHRNQHACTWQEADAEVPLLGSRSQPSCGSQGDRRLFKEVGAVPCF